MIAINSLEIKDTAFAIEVCTEEGEVFENALNIESTMDTIISPITPLDNKYPFLSGSGFLFSIQLNARRTKLRESIPACNIELPVMLPQVLARWCRSIF